jgi:hypothetical protein
MYSFAFTWFGWFQDNSKQTGIKNVVNKIIKYDRPSIAKIKLLLDEKNHGYSSSNWNWNDVKSKKHNKKIEKLKITSDQKSEKICIDLLFKVFFIKDITKIPNRGKTIKNDSITQKTFYRIWTYIKWLRNSQLYQKMN